MTVKSQTRELSDLFVYQHRYLVAMHDDGEALTVADCSHEAHTGTGHSPMNWPSSVLTITFLYV